MEAYRSVCNYVSRYIFQTHDLNKKSLHRSEKCSQPAMAGKEDDCQQQGQVQQEEAIREADQEQVSRILPDKGKAGL